MAVLFVVLLAGIPLAGWAAFGWANSTGMRNEAAQAGWRQTSAVMLENAPQQAHAMHQASPEPLVRGQWTAPDGTRHVGVVRAPAGTRAGTKVVTWTDPSGRLQAAPERRADVTVWDAFVAVAAALGVVMAVTAAGFLARWVLDRRRLAAWDAAWPVTESRWTGRR